MAYLYNPLIPQFPLADRPIFLSQITTFSNQVDFCFFCEHLLTIPRKRALNFTCIHFKILAKYLGRCRQSCHRGGDICWLVHIAHVSSTCSTPWLAQNCTFTYSWIACQLEVGTPIITFAVEVQFQIRDQFWIPQLKLHGGMVLVFLVKTSIRAFRVFCWCLD